MKEESSAFACYLFIYLFIYLFMKISGLNLSWKSSLTMNQDNFNPSGWSNHRKSSYITDIHYYSVSLQNPAKPSETP